MYWDRQLTPSWGQSIAAAAGTVVSTDKIDLATVGRDISRHNELRAVAQLGAAVTSAGAATVDVQLVESASADLSSPVVLASTGALALAALTAGAVLMDIPVPATELRYLGFQYVIGTATTTAGTVNAGLVKNSQTAIGNRPTGNTGL
jgi:hypothetical protein